MSLETEIREAFERHATDVRPQTEAWSTVERRIRISHRRRSVAVAFGAAVFLAAVAIVTPRIVSDDQTPVVPGPVPTAGWKTYENRDDGYRVSHPPTWTVERVRGFTVLLPPDVPIDGEKALFSVTLGVDQGNYEDGSNYSQRPEFVVSRGSLPGRLLLPYVRVEVDVTTLPRQVRYLVDWTTPLCPRDAPCPRPAAERYLDVGIFGATPQLWKSYGATAERIFTTIQPIPTKTGVPSPTPAFEPRVFAKVSVPAFALAAGKDSLWALVRPEQDGEKGKLVRIDPERNQADASINVGVAPNAVAADADAVWVVNGSLGTSPFPDQNAVLRIDPETIRAVAEIRVQRGQDIVVGYDAVWVTSAGAPDAEGITLVRIDPATNRVSAQIPLGGTNEVAHVAAGKGYIWVTTVPSGGDRTMLHRIDPRTNKITRTIEVPAGELGVPLTVSRGSAWVGVGQAIDSANALTRIDAVSGEVLATIVLPDPAPIGVGALTSGDGSVWVTGGRGSLWKVDPATNSPVGDQFQIGQEAVPAGDLVFGFGSLWAASGTEGIWRLAP